MLPPRKILLPVTTPRAAIRLAAAAIAAAQTAAVIVVETAVEIAAVDAVAAGAAVVPEEAAVVAAIVVDITMARVDAICLPQNTLRRRVIAIRAATTTVAPMIVSPALPWTRPTTISFYRANRSPSIAPVPFLLP
jgi:hypothetical protein